MFDIGRLTHQNTPASFAPIPLTCEKRRMFEPDLTFENAVKVSRFDTDNPLSSCSAYPIVLEDKNWLTVEHYLQANLVASSILSGQIEKAESGRQANAMARPWYRFKRKGWKNMRRVLLTRALYTKVQMYDDVAKALLETGDQLIVETSQYDHYWGVGRDQRGDNMYGKVLMDVRSKLQSK